MPPMPELRGNVPTLLNFAPVRSSSMSVFRMTGGSKSEGSRPELVEMKLYPIRPTTLSGVIAVFDAILSKGG